MTVLSPYIREDCPVSRLHPYVNCTTAESSVGWVQFGSYCRKLELPERTRTVKRQR